MGMSISQKVWTVEMLDALPNDGNRYEFIDGVLFVTPSPLNVHQRAIGELYLLLAPYAKRVGLYVMFAPAAVRWPDRGQVEPDLFVIPRECNPDPLQRGTDGSQLVLVVESLSPSTRRADLTTKRDLYQGEAVPEYWIIDTKKRAIDRWTPTSTAAERLSTQLVWHPVAAFDPLVINLDAYFREVHLDRTR